MILDTIIVRLPITSVTLDTKCLDRIRGRVRPMELGAIGDHSVKVFQLIVIVNIVSSQFQYIFVCVSGIWCSEPQAPLHGFVMGTGRQYGDQVRYACSSGHRLIGLAESTCHSDGNWSADTPQCEGKIIPRPITIRIIAKCVPFHQPALTCDSPPPSVPHGFVPLAGKSVIGAHLNIGCQEGFSPVGDLTVHCLPNQQWSAIKGHCKSNQ